MTLANRVLLVAACGLAVTSVPVAHAQSAGAEALFREGRSLIKQGKLEAGCAKLVASEKLESSVGTLLNLGDCRERLGKVASAWAAFRKAEAMARRAGDDKKREREAKRRAEKLEPTLSNLVIQVGKGTPGIVIRRDGEPLDPAVFNTSVPVDPGAHTIVAEAPGYKPFKVDVSIGKGGRRYVVIPSLERVPEPIAETPAPAPVVVTPSAEPAFVAVEPAADTVVTRSSWTPMRKIAVGAATLGAIAIGGGVYFGSRANDLQADSDVLCPQTECGDPEGLRLNDDAQTAAMRANILFLAGGAAVAAATVMWFVGKPEEQTVIAPAIGSGQVGAAFVGSF